MEVMEEEEVEEEPAPVEDEEDEEEEAAVVVDVPLPTSVLEASEGPAGSSVGGLEEEEEEEPPDRLTKDEVVNCICQINEENGLMIQVSGSVVDVRFLFHVIHFNLLFF